MQKYMIKNLMNQNYYFIATKSMKNEAWQPNQRDFCLFVEVNGRSSQK